MPSRTEVASFFGAEPGVSVWESEAFLLSSRLGWGGLMGGGGAFETGTFGIPPLVPPPTSASTSVLFVALSFKAEQEFMPRP